MADEKQFARLETYLHLLARILDDTVEQAGPEFKDYGFTIIIADPETGDLASFTNMHEADSRQMTKQWIDNEVSKRWDEKPRRKPN